LLTLAQMLCCGTVQLHPARGSSGSTSKSVSISRYILMPESTSFTQYTGELAALISAFLWAQSAVLYGYLGKQIPPMGLNFAKAGVALIMISATIALRQDFTPQLPLPSLGLLGISGILGIAIGDTFYFRALQCLGARRTLLLGTLSPPMAALMALLFLREVLPLAAWLGIGITIAGVIWVISERTTGRAEPPRLMLQGVGFALLFSLAQAAGAVLSRAALAGTAVDPLWAAGLRLGMGWSLLFIWGLTRQKLGSWLRGFSGWEALGLLVLAAFMGTFLGIWLQQLSLKYVSAGIAQTMSSTSPLFVLPAAALMGDKISPRALLGVLIALAGIAILFR
jgi:drug/metabolite transporter (DMT)-like permease